MVLHLISSEGGGDSDRCVDPDALPTHSAHAAGYNWADSGAVPVDGRPSLGFRPGQAAPSPEACEGAL